MLLQCKKRLFLSLSAALTAFVIYLPSLHGYAADERVMKLTSDAEHGSLSAELELGARYMTGDGVPRDPAVAARWYEKAAQRGEPNAQNQIGYLYESGIGVHQDLTRALHWYQLSAASGDASALLNIGTLYFTGTGVKQDVSYAASLFENAVRKGSGTAAAYLGDIYYFGSLGTVDLSLAEKWFEAGTRMHDPIATYNLGSLYSTEPRHPHDFHKAAALLRSSASDGYVPAMHSLALLLINHPKEEQTNREARSMLEAAAAAGEWKSSVVLGILARDGKGVPVDKRAADYYFHVAILQGGKPAEDLLRYDLSRLDPLFDPAERDAILAQARSWQTQHAEVKRFVLKDPREVKFFPIPQNTDSSRNVFTDVQPAQSSEKEAPCTGT